MTMERISELGIDLVKYSSTEGVTTKIIDKPILKQFQSANHSANKLDQKSDAQTQV
jgi:hypothetical protein